jgi:hypothetical protein
MQITQERLSAQAAKEDKKPRFLSRRRKDAEKRRVNQNTFFMNQHPPRSLRHCDNAYFF